MIEILMAMTIRTSAFKDKWVAPGLHLVSHSVNNSMHGSCPGLRILELPV